MPMDSRQNGQQAYGQANGQYAGNAYAGVNYGEATVLNDENGQPVKNSFGMKITFSILEILCCCGCNLITMIMGIIGCVFTSKANSAYKSGDVQEYKRNSKSATICLWIGFAIALYGWSSALFSAYFTATISRMRSWKDIIRPQV